MTRQVVLVNGWGMTREAWQPLVAALPGQYELHMLDLHELDGDRLSDLAAATAKSAPSVCDVIGWSLGAQVALQWACDCPGQVRRAVLIAATPCFVSRADWTVGMEPAVFEAFAAQVEDDAAAALNRFSLLQARGDANTAAVARVLRAALASDTACARRALRAGLACLREDDLRALARAVAQPVYLVHGAEDALVPVAAAPRLHELLPHGRLRVMPGAGHAPHVSQPAALAASIAEFLDDD